MESMNFEKGYFGKTPKNAKKRYIEYVNAGLG